MFLRILFTLFACCLLPLTCNASAAQVRHAIPQHRQGTMLPAMVSAIAVNIVRVSWEPIPGAVEYEFQLVNPQKNIVVMTKKPVYANGLEFMVDKDPQTLKVLSWRIRPLDLNGNPIGNFSKLTPLTKATLNPRTPETTGEYGKMAYMPLYPVYSWIPYLNAAQYQINVYKLENPQSKTSGKLIATYKVPGKDNFDFYDPKPYVEPGTYYWQIRALDSFGYPMSNWSGPAYFTRRHATATIAALGDSITHGGGAIDTPPSFTVYDWETYCQVPILNLGYSGDTTAAMLSRFNRDVLPFKPQVLVIMGGINDIRLGTPAQDVINNLTAICQLCHQNGILPILVSVTPVNPDKMKVMIGAPAANWQEQLKILNQWIMAQPDSINITKLVSDKQGLLRADYTSDGLHPDMQGKRLIGEAINDGLKKNQPAFYYLAMSMIKN